MDAQPLAADRLAERLAQGARLARQDVVHSLDHVDVGAETRERLGQLDADGTAAEDHEAAGDLAYAGGLAVGPDAVQLSQPVDRRDHRLGSGGDHDVTGGVASAVHLEHARLDDPATAAN